MAWPVPAAAQGNAIVPLRPQARWTYDVHDGNGTRRVVLAAAGQALVWHAADGRRRLVHQLFERDGEALRFRYFAAEPDGIFRYPNAVGPTRPGIDPAAAATRLVPLPADAGATWRTRVGTVAATGRVVSHATLELPAGTFRALHCRLDYDGVAAGAADHEELWLAAGTGIVQQRFARGDTVLATWQLRTFEPGPDVVGSGEVVSDYVRREHGLVYPAVRVAWVFASPRTFFPVTRFALAISAGERRAYAVRGGQVVPFEPTDGDAIAALLDAEQFPAGTDGDRRDGARVQFVAEVACRVLAAQAGIERPSERELDVEPDAGNGLLARVATADDEPVAPTVRVQVDEFGRWVVEDLGVRRRSGR